MNEWIHFERSIFTIRARLILYRVKLLEINLDINTVLYR